MQELDLVIDTITTVTLCPAVNGCNRYPVIIGSAREKINAPEKEAYNLSLASNIKAQVSCAVMSIGGFRSFDVTQKAVCEAGMDYIFFSGPLIREPDLADRLQRGDTQPATCISCNKCFVPGVKEGGIYCVVEKKERRRKRRT